MKTQHSSKKAPKAPHPTASGRLDRLALIAHLAQEVFENKEKAASWLVTPNEALGDNSPARQCETEKGTQQVRRVLNAL